MMHMTTSTRMDVRGCCVVPHDTGRRVVGIRRVALLPLRVGGEQQSAHRIVSCDGLHVVAVSSGGGLVLDGRRVGVVIVDHGSKRAAANEMLDGVVGMYRDMMEGGEVVCVTKAHMELASPSILEAVKTCVYEHAVDLVVVAPFFLSRGRHIQEDIPNLVREAVEEVRRDGRTRIECIVAEPLGLDAGVVAVMKKRVDDALANS